MLVTGKRGLGARTLCGWKVSQGQEVEWVVLNEATQQEAKVKRYRNRARERVEILKARFGLTRGS